MSKNNEQNSEEYLAVRQAREQKIKDFKIDYSQDDQNTQAESPIYSDMGFVDDLDDNEINSYSGEDVKEQMTENSRKYLKHQKRMQKKQEKKRNKKNRRTFRLLWLASVIIVGSVLAVYLLVGVNDMLAINRNNDTQVSVKIPESPTLKDVSRALKEAGAISETSFFEMYAKITKSADGFHQGDYRLKTNLDYEAIINFLQGNSNRTDIVTVTITEGQNILEIADTLKNAGVLSDTEEFLVLCNSTYFDSDYEFLQNIKKPEERYYKLEGYLYPDTYDFYINEEPKVTITRFLNNFETSMYQRQTIEGYDKRVKISDLIEGSGYSMDQILSIASIVQAEAASNDDMYYISSIIHNRLERGEELDVASLGLDSTMYYPYRSEDKIPKDIKSNFKSRYNTYNFAGLPPGSICNPGTQAILAAINPYETDYLYFCHSEDGTPYYASNIWEHQYNQEVAGIS